MSSIIWQKPLEYLSLALGEIHIWRASLALAGDFPVKILSAEEIRRGRRFLREEHRRRFCWARIFLRQILAHYLPQNPAQIQFREGPHGKLYIANIPTRIQFNLSHSRDLALYAVTLDREIGIDTEWMNSDLLIQPLAARFFTAAECQAVLTLPPNQQIAGFYRIWTRKEAYLKALGLGLSGLSQTLTEETVVIQSLDPDPDYAGAVALMTQSPESSLQIKFLQSAA